jgi:hypothetical protein
MEEDNTNSNHDEHNDEDCEMMHETEDQEEHDTEPTRENEEETVLNSIQSFPNVIIADDDRIINMNSKTLPFPYSLSNVLLGMLIVLFETYEKICKCYAQEQLR